MESNEYLAEQLNRMEDKFDEKLDKILIQTTKTNGRVIAIEKWKEKAETQIEKLTGVTDYNKGRDYTWKLVILTGGAIIGFIIEHFLLK